MSEGGTRNRFGLLILSAAIAIAYLLFIQQFAATTIQRSDGPEFALLAARGGLAHPSGYSNFLYLSEWFLSLTGRNPYYGLSLFSVCCTALTLGLLIFFCLTQCGFSIAAIIAAIAWSLSLPGLLTATDAEVFAFNHLLSLVILISSFAVAAKPSIFKMVLFGILFGASLGHHLLILLLSPCAVLVVWSYASVEPAHRIQRFIQSAAILTISTSIGFSSVLTVLPRYYSNPELSFTNVDSWIAFVICVFRLGYGFWSAGATESSLQQYALPIFFSEIAITTPLLLLGLYSLWVAIRRKDRYATTIGGLVLFQLLFLLLLHVESDFSEVDWLHRFFSLPLLIFAVATSFSIEAKNIGGRLIVKFVFYLLAVITAIKLPQTFAEGVRSNHTESEQYVREQLRALPPKAIVITTSDLLGFGARYLQELEGVRSDVLILNQGRLGSLHFRALLRGWLAVRYNSNETIPESDIPSWLCRFGDPVVVEGADASICVK